VASKCLRAAGGTACTQTGQTADARFRNLAAAQAAYLPESAYRGAAANFRCVGGKMKSLIKSSILALVLCTPALLVSTAATADEWPLIAGDFWEVTGIDIKDGGGMTYANFLASEWRENQEFAKSKGWTKGYYILANAYPRKGEADLYLITVRDRLVSGPEGEKRQAEYMEWKKKSLSQMDKESGDRLAVREILNDELLQELKFRK
jgi:hypothetical protein